MDDRDRSVNTIASHVTEDRQLGLAEARLASFSAEQGESLYRTLVENIHLGITLIDRQHRIVTINGAHAKMIGRPVEACIGTECFRLFEKRETVCPHCPGAQAMQTGRPAEVETAGIRDDGSTYAARVQAFPVRGPEGAIDAFIELVEDITDRKRTEQELDRARLAAEAANRAKSEFLANMSHEIRTPMTAILGFCDILLDELVEPHTIEAANIIKSNGIHLLHLINDILDLSKIEAGKHDLEFQACCPQQLVSEVVHTMQVRAEAKGLSLSVQFLGDLPETIWTDFNRLRQILVNLIGNAIKFTEQGSVRVAVQLDSESRESTRLRFDIIDTGIGMSDDQIAMLFRPFSQVDTSMSRRFGGTGLGLAISQRLARMLGGDIWVSSSLGKGSTFTATVAAGPPDKLRPTTHSPSTARAASPTRQARRRIQGQILLVEDGPDNQRLIGYLLRADGAEVIMVENGQMAVDLALQRLEAGRPFDLILMDMQMPVMDGYEATRTLRTRGYTGPIVALTAHAMKEDRQKCLQAGCDDYVPKPIDRDQLVRTVQTYTRLPDQPSDPVVPLAPMAAGDAGPGLA